MAGQLLVGAGTKEVLADAGQCLRGHAVAVVTQLQRHHAFVGLQRNVQLQGAVACAVFEKVVQQVGQGIRQQV
ncbi:hypothetical protein D3C72_2243270 [compost metagenome]